MSPSETDSPERRRPRVGRGYAAFTIGAIAALAGLAYLGVSTTNQLTGGSSLSVVSDPTKAGYVEEVSPSPVQLVALTNSDDQLSAMIMLVPDTSGESGSAVWTMGELLIEGQETDADGEPTVRALRDIFAEDGPAAAATEFGRVMGFGATEIAVVNPDDLADLAEPIGKITVENPDALSTGTGKDRVVAYPSGPLTLEPDQLGDYLTFTAAGEAPANRSIRTRLVLDELLAAGGFGSSVATDRGTDLAQVFSALGSGPISFNSLPVTSQSFKGSFLYRADPEAAQEQFGDLVQSPISAYPGQRPRVRILNASGDMAAARDLAPTVAALGGEVLTLGNTDPLGTQASTVEYVNPAFEAVADRIAGELGVSATQVDGDDSAADISVILGTLSSP